MPVFFLQIHSIESDNDTMDVNTEDAAVVPATTTTTTTTPLLSHTHDWAYGRRRRIHERCVDVLHACSRHMVPVAGSEVHITHAGTTVMREPLLSCRCVGETLDGHRCDVMTDGTTTPFCRRCMETCMYITVAPSGCTWAGLGLFAHAGDAARQRRDRLRTRAPGSQQGVPVFVPGDVIVPYYGERLSSREYARRYDDDVRAVYAMDLVYGVTIDCARVRSPCAYVNDYRNIVDAANARFINERTGPLAGSVILVATKTIRDGEEIFTDYGADYWSDSAQDTHHTTTMSAATALPPSSVTPSPGVHDTM